MLVFLFSSSNIVDDGCKHRLLFIIMFVHIRVTVLLVVLISSSNIIRGGYYYYGGQVISPESAEISDRPAFDCWTTASVGRRDSSVTDYCMVYFPYYYYLFVVYLLALFIYSVFI